MEGQGPWAWLSISQYKEPLSICLQSFTILTLRATEKSVTQTYIFKTSIRKKNGQIQGTTRSRSPNLNPTIQKFVVYLYTKSEISILSSVTQNFNVKYIERKKSVQIAWKNISHEPGPQSYITTTHYLSVHQVCSFLLL